MRYTPIQYSLTKEQLSKGFKFAAMDGVDDAGKEAILNNIGIGIHPNVSMSAMDEYAQMNTTATISNWIQFFQYFYPKPISMLTRAMKADQVGGAHKAGEWAQEEIVFPIIEKLGQPRLYSDGANVPYASFNPDWERRTIKRFELGCLVGRLEEERSSMMRLNSADLKHGAISQALALVMNDVYWNGFEGNTYGILNDPNLSPYLTLSTGAKGDTTFATKTFEEITTDFNGAISRLAVQLKGHFDSYSTRLLLVLPTSVMGYLNTANALGKTVKSWLKENYPNMRIEFVDNLNGADGGENVFYLMLDEELNGSFIQGQMFQNRFMLLGMSRQTKGFEEDFGCATAGAFVAQPLAIVRYTGC